MMKKAKAPLKKSNNIKSKPKPAKVVGRVKALATSLAKAITPHSIKAMSPKSTKKPLVKTPPKGVAKTAPSKVAPKAMQKKPIGPISAVLKTKNDLAKPAKQTKEIEQEHKSVKKVSHAPSAPTSPVLTKGPALTKAKAEPKVKGSKMTASQLAEHLEKMCRENACENLASTKGYCRLDYIKNWKKIKRKEMILKEGKLNNYIEELVSKYPDKYIDVIRQDLTTEVNFNKVIHDLELDESIDDLDYDGDSIDALIGGIKKEGEGFDDDEF